MSDEIEFDTDIQARTPSYISQGMPSQVQNPGMAAWLVRHGIIKDEKSAGGILIALVIFNFAVAIAVIYFFVLN